MAGVSPCLLGFLDVRLPYSLAPEETNPLGTDGLSAVPRRFELVTVEHRSSFFFV